MLTTSNGSWKGTTPMSDGYQWQRCDAAGGNCVPIAGATASSYTLGPTDVGSTVRSQVTASNVAGQASAESAQTAVVTNLQTLTFTGTLSKNVSSLSFPLAIGAGEADATLTLSKSASMTVQLVDSAGAVVGQATGKSSPLRLNLPGLAAGSYRYVVSGSGVKGSVGFTLDGHGSRAVEREEGPGWGPPRSLLDVAVTSSRLRLRVHAAEQRVHVPRSASG